nr:triose-phosphate isomerase [Candidatus Synchoanobacter obligatus]
MHAAGRLLREYASLVGDTRLGLLVPHPYLSQAAHLFQDTHVVVGAQSVSGHAQGAHTGQVSVGMLQELGVGTVMIGHSEVRQQGGDFKAALALAQAAGLRVIYCIGEDISAYESGKRDDVLSAQLADLTTLDQVMVAYEPVWSIGTGVVASVDDINAAVSMIRQWLLENIPGNSGEATVLYGGSINENNCEAVADADINGFLMGGASLKPKVMLEVVKLCKQRSY